MGMVRIDRILLPDFIISPIGTELELAEISLAQASIQLQWRNAAEETMDNFGGLPRPFKIGADDAGIAIQIFFAGEAALDLGPAKFAETELVQAVRGIADDDALEIGQAVAVAHRQITIFEMGQFGQVIQSL